MWLLFHRNAKTRTVRGGEQFVETCPECGVRATFVEVEISNKMGLFFVDLVGETQRAYRCGACGQTFDLKDEPDAAPREAPPKSPKELERERQAAERARLEAEQAREEAARARKVAAETRAVRIEDELAELKKRMGR
ncbi:MAG: hypothetical protein K8W52_07145 [Deltaproteobacteria bacterium]|nr:hypothetical protein [Deltaproteobacteria bacterium]